MPRLKKSFVGYLIGLPVGARISLVEMRAQSITFSVGSTAKSGMAPGTI
jgi:hypothetical protein